MCKENSMRKSNSQEDYSDLELKEFSLPLVETGDSIGLYYILLITTTMPSNTHQIFPSFHQIAVTLPFSPHPPHKKFLTAIHLFSSTSWAKETAVNG